MESKGEENRAKPRQHGRNPDWCSFFKFDFKSSSAGFYMFSHSSDLILWESPCLSVRIPHFTPSNAHCTPIQCAGVHAAVWRAQRQRTKWRRPEGPSTRSRAWRDPRLLVGHISISRKEDKIRLLGQFADNYIHLVYIPCDWWFCISDWWLMFQMISEWWLV